MSKKLFYVFISLFVGLSILTYLLEYFKDSYYHVIESLFWILVIPGFLLYVFVTGDIHGWQPGPIGQLGRVLVTGLGSSIFWSVVYYLIKRKKSS